MNKTETTATQNTNESFRARLDRIRSMLDTYECECLNLSEWLSENFDKLTCKKAVDLAKKLEKELKHLRVTEIERSI